MKYKMKQKFFVYFTFFLILGIFSSIYALLIVLNKASSSGKNFNTITFILGIVMFFILGLLAANTAQKNGLFEGMLAAVFIILITLVINFFIKVPFVSNSFIKTCSYIIAACLGGIIGVNFKALYPRRKD